MGNLATPQSVQKLQTALHAKAKAEADYRFYALYDKTNRRGIPRVHPSHHCWQIFTCAGLCWVEEARP